MDDAAKSPICPTILNTNPIIAINIILKFVSKYVLVIIATILHIIVEPIIPAIEPSILFLGLTNSDNLCLPKRDPISYAKVSVEIELANASITKILPCGIKNNNLIKENKNGTYIIEKNVITRSIIFTFNFFITI